MIIFSQDADSNFCWDHSKPAFRNLSLPTAHPSLTVASEGIPDAKPKNVKTNCGGYNRRKKEKMKTTQKM
jgi:hypothetical protein